jgi:hypothetical protein
MTTLLTRVTDPKHVILLLLTPPSKQTYTQYILNIEQSFQVITFLPKMLPLHEDSHLFYNANSDLTILDNSYASLLFQ